MKKTKKTIMSIAAAALTAAVAAAPLSLPKAVDEKPPVYSLEKSKVTDEAITSKISLKGTVVTVGDYTYDYTQRYAYQQLSTREQKMYRNIVKAIFSFDDEVRWPAGMDYQGALKVFAVVFHSEPEIFWVHSKPLERENSLYLSYKVLDQGAVASMIKRIDFTTLSILHKAGTDPYSRIQTFYEEIIHRSDFDKSTAGFNTTIYNCLGNQNAEKRKLQCAGYAKSMQYLCDRAGIECITVVGTNANGGTHAWNIVDVNGQYYNIDTTWGDPINDYDENYITYDYFLVPDSWIHNITHFNVNKAKLDGKMVKLFDVPVCWSDFANYFNMYGKVYYDVNSGKDAIFREIDKAVAAGTQVVEIRVASRDVYDALRDTSCWREFQNYAKERGNVSKLKLLGTAEAATTAGIQVVHYDIIYND